ncbi:MAG: methyl-accepting chemotaxis protein [Peptococcaceae bacterium]|jgi:methyl-accepting chemotaxis protein|nr:methyl-accepting chemotaxis protein [Peptococcaceae bacterium]
MTLRRYRVCLAGAALVVAGTAVLVAPFGQLAAVTAAVVLTVAAFGAAYWIYRFTTPLFTRLNRVTARIGQGDLTEGLDPVQAPGEFGRLYDDVRKVCKGMIKHLGEIVRSMGVLEKDAEQIRRGIEQVVAGGRAQAGGIKEIVDLVETYEGGNKHSTGKSDSAQALARDTGALALAGAGKIASAREMIEKIRIQLQDVEDAAGRIGETVGLIGALSGQTNFLAFSAAIEAARAGDRGRGFGVVAAQVNRLAEGARQSTTAIEEIIEGVRRGVTDAQKAVQEGVEGLRRFESSFDLIRSKAQASLEMAREGGARLKEQVETASHVVENVRSIARVAEETAAAAEAIGSVTGELVGVVERFRAVADTYRI